MVHLDNYTIETSFDDYNQLLLINGESTATNVKCTFDGEEKSVDMGVDDICKKTDICFFLDTTENMKADNLRGAMDWIKGYIKQLKQAQFNIDTMFKFNNSLTPVSIGPDDNIDNPTHEINKVKVTPELMPDYLVLLRFIINALKNTSYLKTVFVLFTSSCHRKVDQQMDRQKTFYKDLIYEAHKLHQIGLKRQFKIMIVHLGDVDAEPILYYRLVDMSTEKSFMCHFKDKITLTYGKMDRVATFQAPRYVISKAGDDKVYEFSNFLGHKFFLTKGFKGKYELHSVLASGVAVNVGATLTGPEYLGKLANLYLVFKNVSYIIINSFKIAKTREYLETNLIILKEQYLDYYDKLAHERPDGLGPNEKAIFKCAKTCYDFLRYFSNLAQKNPQFHICEYLDVLCQAYDVLKK